MTEVTARGGLGRPAMIAIGFAVVALLTSLIAVVVVMRRDREVAAPVVAASPRATLIEHTVDATEVTKLKRDVVDKVTDDRGAVVGVRLTDERLRTAFGLESGDVITAINGRTIKREFDVYDAVLGMSMMDASIVYVEIVRDDAPVTMRWKLEGDLRSTRHDSKRSPLAGRVARGGGGTITTPNPFTADPYVTPRPHRQSDPLSRDPLIDTIRKLDDLHYEVPRSTVERLLANPDAFARQARIVPSIRNGQPDGFRLYAIAPGSLWSAIGLSNGDTIRSINGHDLTSPDKALELYRKIKDATELRVAVGRRGGSEKLVVITIK